jgi:hypothetical protein
MKRATAIPAITASPIGDRHLDETKTFAVTHRSVLHHQTGKPIQRAK